MSDASLVLRRIVIPMTQKPNNIIAHVDGSGTDRIPRISPPGNWVEWTLR
jgi:hypothetical protein